MKSGSGDVYDPLFLDRESRIAKAITFFEEQQGSPEQWTITRVAGEFNIPYGTLWHRMHGRLPHSSAHANQQLLTMAEEEELLNWSLALSDARIPFSPRLMRQAATRILQRRDPGNSVGIHWSERFRARHCEFLESKHDRHLPKSRARAVTPEMVEDWFKLVSKRPSDM